MGIERTKVEHIDFGVEITKWKSRIRNVNDVDHLVPVVLVLAELDIRRNVSKDGKVLFEIDMARLLIGE
jgi:hypothetical protein